MIQHLILAYILKKKCLFRTSDSTCTTFLYHIERYLKKMISQIFILYLKSLVYLHNLQNDFDRNEKKSFIID